MGRIIGCLQHPYRRGLKVCVRDDYTTVSVSGSPREYRSRVSVLKVPSRPCGIVDMLDPVFYDPDSFREVVGCPCRITYPCVAVEPTPGSDRGRVLDEVPEEVCLDPPPDLYVEPAFKTLDDLMMFTAVNFGAYLSAVLCGRRKCYPAPYSPTESDFRLGNALEDLGLLPKGFGIEAGMKYGGNTVTDILSMPYEEVRALGFNFYEVRGRRERRYESVAIVWYRSDRTARNTALKLYDIHEEYTKAVLSRAREAVPDTTALPSTAAPPAPLPEVIEVGDLTDGEELDVDALRDALREILQDIMRRLGQRAQQETK